MATLFVAVTTASCTGFAWMAEGSEKELEALRSAVDAFEREDAWRDRGCDGSSYAHEDLAETLEFWNDRVEGAGVRSWQDLVDLLKEDGEASRVRAADLADYLTSFERQEENLLPEAV
jgi:hypothetical protein